MNGDGKPSSCGISSAVSRNRDGLGQSEIAGKTILVHAEQGFGDTIQFCRYVPLVAERGARVILEVQEPLRELTTSLGGTTQVVAKDFRAAGFPCTMLAAQPAASVPNAA